MELKEMFKAIRSDRVSREQIVRTLYADQQLKNGVRKSIYFGKPSDEEFSDIFNYTLLQFVKNVMKRPDFIIETNVNSYLFGVARNLWMQKTKKRELEHEALPESFDLKDGSPTIDLLIMDKEKKSLLAAVLDTLGNKCREVLMLWAANYKMKAIAVSLGYASAEVVRKKKFFCMKELSVYMRSHPQIQNQLR